MQGSGTLAAVAAGYYCRFFLPWIASIEGCRCQDDVTIRIALVFLAIVMLVSTVLM